MIGGQFVVLARTSQRPCLRTLSYKAFLRSSTLLAARNARSGIAGVHHGRPAVRELVKRERPQVFSFKRHIFLLIDQFCRSPRVRALAAENGIDSRMFAKCYVAFQQHCMNPVELLPHERQLFEEFKDEKPPDVERIFPLFLEFSQRIFPHLKSVDELKAIADLKQPHSWFPESRSIHRKVIFHAGPTNSGKTHAALERFRAAENGIYCGPLRLLATEVYKRTNAAGIPCDLITGEDRRYVHGHLEPANHMSSTVEMLPLDLRMEVAIIDEIQMLRDEQRGWAWTRALLGAAAEEVHLCGEPSAINICKQILDPIGETIEVREYKRKSPLTISTHALRSLKDVQDGDCIVCFSKRDIRAVAHELDVLKIPCAVIYGSLPPETKLAQAERFNSPEDPTKVLVATDAIGMGMNLNIRRMIFKSLVKPIDGLLIPNHLALQIAGRAGRFGTVHSSGVITTMNDDDLGILADMMERPVEEIKRAGIAPTYEQLECFAQQLPNFTFVRLLDEFINFCNCSSEFFLCSHVQQQMRFLAVALERINSEHLPLNVRYTFCTLPLNPDSRLGLIWFKKMAAHFATGQPVTARWMRDALTWPPKRPQSIEEIGDLEQSYEIMTAYLWLAYRFPMMFPDMNAVRQLAATINRMIDDSLKRLVVRNN